jgi:hypothetical protein
MKARDGAMVLMASALMTCLAAAPAHADGLLARLLGGPLHVPDGYQIDESRDAARYADPVDSDELVSLDLMPGPWKHSLLELRCDDEYRPATGGGGPRIGLRLKIQF